MKEIRRILFGLSLCCAYPWLTLLSMGQAYALIESAPQVRVPVLLNLKPSTEVERDRLSLTDIATCSGAEQLCEEAYAIDLGLAPAPGKSANLSKRKILEILEKEWPNSDIQIQGPENIRINASFIDIQDEDVLAAVRQELNRLQPEKIDASEDQATLIELSDQPFALTLQRLQGSGTHKLRPTSYRIVVPALANLLEMDFEQLVQCCVGSKRLDVEFWPEDMLGGSVPYARSSYAVHFSLKRQLPVAKQRLEAGQTIGAEHLAWRFWEIDSRRQRWLTNVAALKGRVLKRAVESGNPISEEQTELKMTLKRGQLVRLILQSGDLGVSGQVRTLSQGAYGQVIEVMYPTTKKRLRARVLDSETVEYVR